VIIEHTPSSLLVRVQNARGWGWHWFGGGAVRQQVILALPRRVELTAKGVNGPVKVGEVDGGVDVSGINGRVEVAKLSGHSELSGINGNVKVAVAQLDSEGMKVKGVNGGVEIRTGDGFAADINVKGLNGSVALNVPNVTMQERENRSNMRARLGAGGPSIEIKGINGGVRFESIAPVAPAAGQ
jgi:hypothetical protein